MRSVWLRFAIIPIPCVVYGRNGTVCKVVEIVILHVVRFGSDVGAATFLAMITFNLSDFVAGLALRVKLRSAIHCREDVLQAPAPFDLFGVVAGANGDDMGVLSVSVVPMPVALGMVHADDAMFRHILFSAILDLPNPRYFRVFDADLFVDVCFANSATSGGSPK